MKGFKAIFKAQLISALTSLSRKKSLRIPVLIGVLTAGVVIFYFVVRFAKFLFLLKLPEPFPAVDIAPFVINGVVFTMFIFLLLNSFTIMLSTLYLSSDTKLLLSMPVTERSIFTGKFIFANFEESLYPLFLVYPFFVGFGAVFHLSILFYIVSFLFCISLPLIPFSLAAFIIVPLANRMSVKKLQTLVLVLNMIFGIIIYFISQISNPAFHMTNNKNIPLLLNKIQEILKLLPTNIAVSFSYAFKNYHLWIGAFEVLLFIMVGVAFFYIVLIFVEKDYKEGLFRAERIESIKVSAHSAEKQIIGSKFLSRHINALISKDIKIFMRDPKIKASLFISLAYIGFFLIVFLINPVRSSGKSLSNAAFMPVLYFVIVDFMLCGQNTSVILLLDRESLWVPLMSRVQSNEFIWSKFTIPFISGEVVNIFLFLVSLLLVKGNGGKLLFITLPFAIFLPLLFTASAIFVGMLFPNFKTPVNPRQLVSGKTAAINAILYVIYIFVALAAGFFAAFLVKLKGIPFTVAAMFIIAGVLSIAVSFPLMAFAIRRYKDLEA